MNVDLRLGDCLEHLKTIPDKSIDLVITDPPYIVTTRGGGIVTRNNIESFKEIEFISNGYNEAILPELVRVMKRINIYIFCSHAQILPTLKLFVDGYNCNYTLISWHKTSVAPFCNNNYLKDTEICFHFRERGVPIYGDCQTKKTYYVTNEGRKDKGWWEHPTIKPLRIIRNFIINSSLENETVLDPFMGSGTTGAAAVETGRNFIGMEIDPKYFSIAKKRIDAKICNNQMELPIE